MEFVESQDVLFCLYYINVVSYVCFVGWLHVQLIEKLYVVAGVETQNIAPLS